jgi:hypothetical protein
MIYSHTLDVLLLNDGLLPLYDVADHRSRVTSRRLLSKILIGRAFSKYDVRTALLFFHLLSFVALWMTKWARGGSALIEDETSL